MVPVPLWVSCVRCGPFATRRSRGVPSLRPRRNMRLSAIEMRPAIVAALRSFSTILSPVKLSMASSCLLHQAALCGAAAHWDWPVEDLPHVYISKHPTSLS
jgi:hypothetical protein